MNAKYKFCPFCGVGLVVKQIEGHDFRACPKPMEECGYVHWDNPLPVANAIIPRRHKVALVKRKFNPRAGFWCIPGGFVNNMEHPRDGATRETWEETRLRVILRMIARAVVHPKDVNETISFYVAKHVEGKLEVCEETLDAGWFSQDDLPELAFDSHREELQSWFNRPSVRAWRALAKVAKFVGIEL
jgi:8-oxo-dGTP diphosphatase